MSPAMTTTLTLISGICWTIVYIDLINRGFRDKTYGMPLFALTFNLSWEFTYAFLFTNPGIQHYVNIVWFLLDVVILYTYFRYGRAEFAKTADPKWFIPWSLAALAISFAVIYVAAVELGPTKGAEYSAFAQNLMMSILFVVMLVQRNSVAGQSMYIALFKWIGTLAPTILFYARTGSLLILVFGVGCFIYDLVYIFMLYNKFRALTLNPFTRAPSSTARVAQPTT